MLFNSLNFAIFLVIVFILYWWILDKNRHFQNLLLLVSSYFFYACWDWRFMFLLLFSTLLDFFSGLMISKYKNSKKLWLWISISINLGFLAVFKYYNFFAESFSESVKYLGLELNPVLINIILPVGISFYTFHGLSYLIDVYRDRIKSETNFVDYAVFVSFFPLLVAGPIERANHLLPQIKVNRKFDYLKAVDGLRQILWGIFKKVVIADNCAVFANQIFSHSGSYSGPVLWLGAFMFAFQIYGDFSGYSDIALGTARLFGVELLRNFAFPYFSRDIAEFWRRWHISLSSWFKDYLYIPLGGSKGGKLSQIRNTFVIFIISGFWHGANWTFLFWGFLNAVYISPSILLNKNRSNIEIVAAGRSLPSFREAVSMTITFILTCVAWVFFRAESLRAGFDYIKRAFSFSIENITTLNKWALLITLGLVCIFLIIEWLGRTDKFAIERIFVNKSKVWRIMFYYILLLVIFIFAGTNQEFIYFQF